MSEDKVLDKILSGTNDSNIRFHDLRKLLLKYDFLERIRGDHYIFTKENVAEIINLQPLKDGKAKPYQVKQVRNLFLKYKFHLEEG
ncbi:MAG TPA: type II toxin-antitoxin system HicA family toxin [Candidatus Atribacteria bacterium]|nr:type II toxin-antitoxin system HicA family toxin [Candidatus Atribacteria bacterium]